MKQIGSGDREAEWRMVRKEGLMGYTSRAKTWSSALGRGISRCQGLEPGLHLASLRDRRSDWRMGAGERAG